MRSVARMPLNYVDHAGSELMRYRLRTRVIRTATIPPLVAALVWSPWALASCWMWFTSLAVI